jgi:nucleotide-binding universal stress UspA family protein
MESILVATDFSADAANAARRAALLAAALEVRDARLVHVVPSLPLEAELELRASRAVERLLGEQADALARETGVALAPQIARGGVVDALLAAARPGDLIVVGAHGMHPLRDFAVGSTALRLLRRSAQPVLVVKRPPAQPYRSLLVAVDFSRDSAAALELAARLAPEAALAGVHAFEVEVEGTLRLVGAAEEEIFRRRREARERSLAGIDELLAAHRAQRLVTPIVEHGYAPSVIAAAEQRTGADLVAIGKHGTSRLEDLLLGSVTEHALAHSACDVLVARVGG